MKTAGLVLDFYDDKGGEVLKSWCPSPDDLPESIKTAHFLSSEERNVLRDEAFALILHAGDSHLRKFACVDEGNTALSTLYFLENAEKLPAEAIKTAAQNLIAFNQEFGLDVPPDLLLAAETGLPVREKKAAATALARKRDSKNEPYVGDEADWAQRTNLISVRGGADSGRVIPTANQMKTAAKAETESTRDRARRWGRRGAMVGAAATIPAAMVSGVNPLRYPVPLAVDAGKNALLGYGAGRLAHRVAHGPSSETKKVKKAAHVANVVDVSSMEPRPVSKRKVASRHALGDRYSLDSYSDVTDAIRFFEESWTVMEPADRHEFAVKTAARADELGIQVPALLDRYGSTEYAPDVEAHLANRRQVDPAHTEVWDDLQEKRAMIEPETFAKLLKEADQLFDLDLHWGGAIQDPYFATFGGRGQEKVAWAWQGADGESVDEAALRSIPTEQLSQTFSSDFVEAFGANPTAIFDSMPDAHKALITRMVP